MEKCPICYEKNSLEISCDQCINKICMNCYTLLSEKKCPVCRLLYDILDVKKDIQKALQQIFIGLRLLKIIILVCILYNLILILGFILIVSYNFILIVDIICYVFKRIKKGIEFNISLKVSYCPEIEGEQCDVLFEESHIDFYKIN